MKFLIFGTGNYYERYKKWFAKEDVSALLDNSPEKQRTQIDGIQVLSPEEGIKLPYDAVIILSFYVKEMRQQLLSLGVSENNIYHFYDLHNLIDIDSGGKPVHFYGNARKMIADEAFSGNKLLLLSHDLELGGPALALFHVAKEFRKQGKQVIVASMIDGVLKEKLLEENIPVIIDVNLQIEMMAEAEWIKNFDMIFCNTISFHVFLSKRDCSIPVVWWLHDSPFFYHGVKKEVLESIDRTNLTVCSVGPVPERAIHEFLPELPVKRLLYGVADTVGMEDAKEIKASKARGEICFVTIGYIEERKGQDILVQAIQLISEEHRKKAKFYFVGQKSSMFAQQLAEKAKAIPEIVITGTVNRDNINEILSYADILICPSREDPMPTVCAEAMMHRTACLVSDAAGTAEYIDDGMNGFIFPSTNVQILSEKIEWCILNHERLQDIGTCARSIYDTHFSMEIFERELEKLTED